MNSIIRPAFKTTPTLIGIVVIAAAIALVAPFEAAFEWASRGSWALRIALISALAVAGATCAQRLGLKLHGHGRGAPWRTGLTFAAAIAGYVLVLDVWLFRGILPTGYVDFLHEPLGFRLQYFMLRAFNENVLYRLFAFSMLAWLIQLVAGRRPSPAALIAAMVAAQAINIGLNIVAWDQATPLVLAYDALRYVVPGVVWALLFVRNGFATAEVASVGCHLFLQPAFTMLI